MYRYTDSSDLQDCPAAVDMETGDIWINTDVWDNYTESEQQFILQHELGHYNIPTDYEEEADEYALLHNFGKVNKSLKSSLSALEKANVASEQRWATLYKKALEIDADHGNAKAEKELKRIQSNNYEHKNYFIMRNQPGKITYIMPGNIYEGKKVNVRRNFNRADGEETITPPAEVRTGNTQRPHKTNGITLGNYYLSFTNILLAAIVVILLSKMK